MSNSSVIARVKNTLANVRDKSMSAKDASRLIRGDTQAIEALAYDQVKAIDSLVMDLEIAHWNEGEDGFPDTDDVLQRIEKWLSTVPRT